MWTVDKLELPRQGVASRYEMATALTPPLPGSTATLPRQSKPYDFLLKFLLVGDSDVGKEEILSGLVDGSSESPYGNDHCNCIYIAINFLWWWGPLALSFLFSIFTLHASCGTVYCNWSCLFVGVCVWVGLLPR